ncbi:hypothetical protein [Pantoea eucrina]|uniref:hypothetical protein n=1 Tax=Pantoea eucrina TaxID=472693 RepID=UPI002FD9B378
MPNFSDLEFEKRYKHFLQVQQDWLTLITDNKFFSDTNAVGEECRPAGLLTDSAQFQHAQHLLAEWQSFAELAEEKRKERSIAITTNLYLPVPVLLINPAYVQIDRFRATATANHKREDILMRYEKQISKLKKITHAFGAIMTLEDERKYFEAAPVATVYRARTSTYTDIQVSVRHTTDQHEVDKFRYGAHGMLIIGDDLALGRNVKLNVSVTNTKSSLYDFIQPVPCSVLPSAQVYTLDDVELGKKMVSQRASVAYAVKQRRYQFDKRAKEKMARAKDPVEARAISLEIEAGREVLELMDAHDYELLDRKLAAGDESQLTMLQIRERYGNESDRTGKNIRNMPDFLAKLIAKEEKKGSK